MEYNHFRAHEQCKYHRTHCTQWQKLRFPPTKNTNFFHATGVPLDNSAAIFTVQATPVSKCEFLFIYLQMTKLN